MEVSPTSKASASGASAPKEYRCHCGVGFSRVENYKRHQRKHDLRDYLKCSICQKSFTRPDVLKRHMRIHSSSSTPVLEDRSRGPSVTIIGDNRAQSGSEHIRTVPATVGAGPAAWDSSEQVDWSSSGQPSSASTSTSFPQSLDVASSTTLLDDLNGTSSTVQQTDDLSFSSLDFAFVSNLEDLTTSQSLDWDNNLQWVFQDSNFLLDTQWPEPISLSQTSVPYSLEQTATHSADFLPSRPATPPIDASEEDKWPTNHRPKQLRPFVLGSGGRVQEAMIDPANRLELACFSRFWLDAQLYDRVKTSLTLAANMPGPTIGNFHLPVELKTVNTFMSLYFQHFHPQLPILHLPTFDINAAPPLLIAGMIGIGAGFSNLSGSRAFTVDIIDVIRRSLAALFESDGLNMRDAGLIHASLLITFAGLLSGHQRTFELAEVSRGLLIHLCRRAQLLDSSLDPHVVLSSFVNDPLEERWHKWAVVESRRRLGLAVFFLDSLFPSFFDSPSYTSQGEMLSTVLPTDELFWELPSAQVWQAMLGLAPIPPSPYFATAVSAILTPKFAPIPPRPIQNLNPFASLCLVTALHHHVYEYTAQLSVYSSIGLFVPSFPVAPTGLLIGEEPGAGFEGRKNWLTDALLTWKRLYYGSESTPINDVLLSGRTLCHLGLIALHVDVRMLYASAGKYGLARAKMARPQLSIWANTTDAQAAPRNLVNGCPATFVAILCLWVYVSSAPPSVHEVLQRLSNEVLHGEQIKNADGILVVAARCLAKCRAWRIGAAYTLVLAKLIGVSWSDS